MNKYFTKEILWMENKNTKRCVTSLVIREMQTEPQWDSTMQPREWLKWNRLTIPSVDEEVEELELSYIVDGEIKWQTLGKYFDSLLKI